MSETHQMKIEMLERELEMLLKRIEEIREELQNLT